MAKRAICDVCRAEDVLEEPYASIPRTWFSLRRGYNDEQHICSLPCLAKAVDERRAKETAAANAVEASAIA